MKRDEKYVIEAKGDLDVNHSFRIKYAIGEIVAHMCKGEENVHYGIAIPHTTAVFLSKFGLEGLRRLNLHLFCVENIAPLLIGMVWHLAPEGVLKYVKELREGRVSPGLFRPRRVGKIRRTRARTID